MGEHLLDMLKYVHTKGILLGIRDLGTFFVDNEHTFPTWRLGPDSISKVTKKLDSLGIEYRFAGRKKDVIQVRMPVRRAYEDGEFMLPEEFRSGHYTEQARWSIARPNSKARVSERL